MTKPLVVIVENGRDSYVHYIGDIDVVSVTNKLTVYAANDRASGSMLSRWPVVGRVDGVEVVRIGSNGDG